MTEEAIRARIAELQAQQEQWKANLNATGGAIQDCEYWLAQMQLNKPESSNAN